MRDNEDFLHTVFKEHGRTNLGDYWLNYLRDKEIHAQREKMKGVMLPPSLIESGQSSPFLPPLVL